MIMATSTTNLGLTKPVNGEDVSLPVINGNTEILDTAFGRNNVFVSLTSLSALPYTATNSKITANHRVVNCVLSNTGAQTGDWSYSTASGSVTISGSISGTTNVYLYLSEFY